MTESMQLLKRFALTALLSLCVISMLCGAALVDANTRYLSLGDPGRQVGLVQDKETVTLQWDEQAVALPPLHTALQWARLAPAPLGSLVALSESLWQALDGMMI